MQMIDLPRMESINRKCFEESCEELLKLLDFQFSYMFPNQIVPLKQLSIRELLLQIQNLSSTHDSMKSRWVN